MAMSKEVLEWLESDAVKEIRRLESELKQAQRERDELRKRLEEK